MYLANIDRYRKVFNETKKLRVLCVGEAIQDIYRYVQPVGRATKDPIVTWAGNVEKSWTGGTEAVGNHLKGGIVGEVQTDLSPTLQKVRYVEQPFGRKVFSVVMETRVKTSIPWDYTPPQGPVDLVIVTDYGHGMWDDPKKIERCLYMWKKQYGNPMIALNVQANSLNWGMSLITKWPRADYVVCNENELRLAMSDAITRRGKLAQLLKEKLGAKALVVTLGHEGAELYGDKRIECPALCPPDAVVDRMGAGDAFLAASAPVMALGQLEDALWIGSAAAALQVQEVGNGLQLTPQMILGHLEKKLVELETKGTE